MNTKKLATLFVFTAGVCWGLIGAFVRLLQKYNFDSMQINSIRSTLTFLLLFFVLLIFKPSLLKIKWKDLWIFICSGIGSITFFNYCYFQAIQLTSLSIAVILLYTSPFFVTLLSALLFHEKITLKKGISLFFTLTGCLLITGVYKNTATLSPIALLYGLGAGFGYSLYSIFGHYAVKKYHSLTITTYTFLFTSICSTLIANPRKTFTAFTASKEAILPFIFFAIVCSILPYLFYTIGLANMKPGKAAIIVCVEPIVSTLIGIFYMKEIPTKETVIGILFVLLAIFLLNTNFSFNKEKYFC